MATPDVDAISAAVFVSRMFTIIGGDGKEYGPVSTAQLKIWINAGRANVDTQARSVGSEEWRRLGDFPEFSSPEVAPPVMPAPAPTVTAFVPTIDAGLQSATLGQRFAGALIDGILKLLCWMPTAFAMWAALGDQFRSGQQPTAAELMEAMNGVVLRSLPFLIVLAIVQGVFLSLRGQSVGKILVRTRIVRYADNAKAGFLHAFLLRGAIPWVIEQIPLLGLLFWLIDVCFIFGDERRCVHDYIAGTKVVKADL